MRKLLEITKYEIETRPFSSVNKLSKNEFVFPIKTNSLILKCKSENEDVQFFDLDDPAEVTLQLTSAFFSMKKFNLSELIAIKDSFNLEQIDLENNNFKLYFLTENGYNNCFLKIKKTDTKYFVILFATRKEREPQSMAEDSLPDNIYYIHGIWQVELSPEFAQKIFG